MASIIKKKKNGHTYYYAAQSGRVNGKPRIIWQKYLGTLDDIVKRAEGSTDSCEKEAVIFEAGGIAAMLGIAEKIGITEIIDEVVPKGGKKPSVGEYMLLAALNRILAPCSKLKMPEWYKSTILYRLWRHPPGDFNSQRFWDYMDLVSTEQINVIQEKIALKLKTNFKINPGVLLYDTTNFFTFIATNNNRNTIAKRGRSKAKRNDLRQVGLALMVSKDFQIPLFHRVYEGNLVDQGLFQQMSKEMMQSYNSAFDNDEKPILIYDKGNISEEAQEQLIISRQPFICAVPKYTLPELFETPISKLQQVADIPGTKTLTCEVQIWNTRLKAVLSYSEAFFTSQMYDLVQEIQKTEEKLRVLDKKYAKWGPQQRQKRPTLKEAKEKAAAIIGKGCLKDVFSLDVKMENNLPRVYYNIDQNRIDYITRHQLGRTLLITPCFDLSESKIVKTYRGLSDIESVFRHMKNQEFLHWQPEFHWTDQKICVHGFYCVLAMLLASLAHKVITEQGIDISLLEMLDELSDIREVALISVGEGKRGRKGEVMLSKMTPKQRRIATALDIAKFTVGNTKTITQKNDT